MDFNISNYLKKLYILMFQLGKFDADFIEQKCIKQKNNSIFSDDDVNDIMTEINAAELEENITEV